MSVRPTHLKIAGNSRKCKPIWEASSWLFRGSFLSGHSTLRPPLLVLVSRACCNKQPRTAWLEFNRFIVSQIWKPRVQIQVCLGLHTWKLSRRVVFCLFQSWQSWHPSLLGASLQSLTPWSHFLPLLCVRIFSSSVSYKDVCHRTQGHLGWSHLKLLNLITPAKTLFPKKVTFPEFGYQDLDISFWRPLLSTLHSPIL